MPVPPRSSLKKGVKQRVVNIFYQVIEDPRVGPALFLAAVLSFGRIWLKGSKDKDTIDSRSSSAQQTQSLANTTATIPYNDQVIIILHFIIRYIRLVLLK